MAKKYPQMDVDEKNKGKSVGITLTTEYKCGHDLTGSGIDLDYHSAFKAAHEALMGNIEAHYKGCPNRNLRSV